MKLFFASDLHGCLASTKKVLEAYKASGAEHFVLLGDILNHGPRNPVPKAYAPAEVALLLNEYKDDIICVRGNCDSEVDQMLLDFPIMSDFAMVLLEGGQRLFLTHGHLYNQSKLPHLKQGDVLAHGHTHLPVAESKGEYILFNPGSSTLPKGGNVASYGLLNDKTLSVLSFEGQVLAETQI
ncbi:YfcE family phosphodiesterase [Vibrio sp. UCD-FRSSP16_10]|uniref:phosphodiesterase n=1 Tax=unclassified Vibrio TaxID=2614977 RepID=UPI0008007E01|nr:MULTISPECIES: phosphodiesterase [unclassified Vibrio]OBT08612.1 YfcE family phosphodiesterase [Vibrio sp. UCD-FRSSP16_30]OBT18142.1 YfcE family phosphodiesterase [Vibrio sp. UCD-FRSSP16_10]